MRWILGAGLLAIIGCAPAHMKELSLSGSDHTLQEVFMGGWDGQSLRLFDDTTLSPGKSTFKDVVQAIHNLSSELYVAIYIEPSHLDPKVAAAHALFCQTVSCIAVLERKDGDSIDQWGNALAIFELNGISLEPMGSVWLQEKAVRDPGPRHWPLMCRAKSDQPRYVHEDGSALFPAQTVGSATFAVFGPQDLPAQYRAGFHAPAETTCDEEVAKLQKEPQPPRPDLKPDPSLIQKLK